MDGQVHLGHSPGTLIEFLTIDGNCAAVTLGNLQELFRLHKHATRTTAWVIHTPLSRLKDFYQRPHDRLRSIELTAPLTFSLGELIQKVLVDLP